MRVMAFKRLITVICHNNICRSKNTCIKLHLCQCVFFLFTLLSRV
uniref:Uncharacterized protein n=1 Tax=Anguilla anguilla TaxID=7936 RepID=A0A0E9PHU3_ANGAN